VNWEAISATGDFVGAVAVVVTLVYLAVQVRDAKRATADQSRIYRATAVREMILQSCTDDALRIAQIKSWGLVPYYEAMATTLNTTVDEATRIDFANAYYFWMWWGQYASTTEDRDRQELRYIVRNLGGTPGMLDHWKNSPVTRPLIDRQFAQFVDEILSSTAD
jgi:hypothetical protein